MNLKSQQGYVALISILIVSLVLFTVTFILSFTSFFGRSNVLDAEYKARSLSLAEACLDIALLELANDNPPAGNSCFDIGNRNCAVISILPILPDDYPKTIQTQARFQNSYTNLEIEVNTDLEITSWQDLDT